METVCRKVVKVTLFKTYGLPYTTFLLRWKCLAAGETHTWHWERPQPGTEMLVSETQVMKVSEITKGQKIKENGGWVMLQEKQPCAVRKQNSKKQKRSQSLSLVHYMIWLEAWKKKKEKKNTTKVNRNPQWSNLVGGTQKFCTEADPIQLAPLTFRGPATSNFSSAKLAGHVSGPALNEQTVNIKMRSIFNLALAMADDWGYLKIAFMHISLNMYNEVCKILSLKTQCVQGKSTQAHNTVWVRKHHTFKCMQVSHLPQAEGSRTDELYAWHPGAYCVQQRVFPKENKISI